MPNLVAFKFIRMLVISQMFLSSSCTATVKDHIVSKPTISQDNNWKIEQGCGYERCGPPPVDFLVGQNVSIRIEPHIDKAKNRFAILLAFIPKGKVGIAFDPSRVQIELAHGQNLSAAGYLCAGKIWDDLYRRTIAPLRAPVTVTLPKVNCFMLFFDAPPPDVSETFRLKLLGVLIDGAQLEVPEVVFQKGISRW